MASSLKQQLINTTSESLNTKGKELFEKYINPLLFKVAGLGLNGFTFNTSHNLHSNNAEPLINYEEIRSRYTEKAIKEYANKFKELIKPLSKTGITNIEEEVYSRPEFYNFESLDFDLMIEIILSTGNKIKSKNNFILNLCSSLNERYKCKYFNLNPWGEVISLNLNIKHTANQSAIERHKLKVINGIKNQHNINQPNTYEFHTAFGYPNQQPSVRYQHPNGNFTNQQLPVFNLNKTIQDQLLDKEFYSIPYEDVVMLVSYIVMNYGDLILVNNLNYNDNFTVIPFYWGDDKPVNASL